jgi:hypothetical protein
MLDFYSAGKGISSTSLYYWPTDFYHEIFTVQKSRICQDMILVTADFWTSLHR